MKIAALSDIHIREDSGNAYDDLFHEISNSADVLLLCGDLTDHGSPAEAEVLAKKLQMCRIPILAVFGNHDFEMGEEQKIKEILTQVGVHILDGDPIEIDGVGFVGVKGFCGGFDNHMLPAWGEAINKQFVQAAVDESLKLEAGLSRLQTPHKIVLMHYSPIRQTVEGEPVEILAFLGSSRMIDPIEHLGVTAVFHGHAHHGTQEGKTEKGIPVFNVCHSLVQGYRTYEIKEVKAV